MKPEPIKPILKTLCEPTAMVSFLLISSRSKWPDLARASSAPAPSKVRPGWILSRPGFPLTVIRAAARVFCVSTKLTNSSDTTGNFTGPRTEPALLEMVLWDGNRWRASRSG